MFDADDLKTSIAITETTVECPVKGCGETVARQRVSFKRERQFQCPRHKIYISPSTFEYPDKVDNLLWHDREDLSLLQAIHGVKRESRMARERSEDALTWNVFRHLEKHDLIAPCLSSPVGISMKNPRLVYWSYSHDIGGTWPLLAQARSEFGEKPRRSSEPDLIVVSDDALFFIESKFTADNKTTPSRPQDTKRYLTGGNGWYQQVFESDYNTLAILEQRYELFRFWLLGTWTAAQLGCDFYLINLVREEREKDIEQLFIPHLKTGSRRQFLRWTWEDIYNFVSKKAPPSQDRDFLISYFENKTAGYYRRELQLAFQVSRPKV